MAAGVTTLIVQLLLGVIIDARVASSTQHLQATLEELRRKNAEVEAFVYIVSHDLRAPLVNLQGFSRELEMNCIDLKRMLGSLQMPEAVKASVEHILDSDFKRALHFIASASSKFERLIDSLLQLSQQDRQNYNLVPIDIRGLVRGAQAALQTEIDHAGASIVVEELPNCSGDNIALSLVFSNLLTNALRYRDHSRSLVVRVGGRREKDTVHVWVSDNGVGIPAPGMSRLFRVFQRLHPELAPGEGIGLAVVQRIIERHNGRVWAESTVGAGTTFHFLLPVMKSSAPVTEVQELLNHAC